MPVLEGIKLWVRSVEPRPGQSAVGRGRIQLLETWGNCSTKKPWWIGSWPRLSISCPGGPDLGLLPFLRTVPYTLRWWYRLLPTLPGHAGKILKSFRCNWDAGGEILLRPCWRNGWLWGNPSGQCAQG